MSMVLLGSLLLLMVHNIIPHTHHNHGDSQVYIEHDHHHHEGVNSHEQSNNQDSGEENESGILILFFAHHSHTNPTNAFISTVQLELGIFNENPNYPNSLLHSGAISSIYAWGRIGKYFNNCSQLYDCFSISKCSSRAPPYLG